MLSPEMLRGGERGLHVTYHFAIELDREEDGRWIAEIPSLPGVIVYGETRSEAVQKVRSLALRVLAERLEDEPPKTRTPKEYSLKIALG
jgi:predicted RNase H-like HicB family nuclease